MGVRKKINKKSLRQKIKFVGLIILGVIIFGVIQLAKPFVWTEEYVIREVLIKIPKAWVVKTTKIGKDDDPKPDLLFEFFDKKLPPLSDDKEALRGEDERIKVSMYARYIPTHSFRPAKEIHEELMGTCADTDIDRERIIYEIDDSTIYCIKKLNSYWYVEKDLDCRFDHENYAYSFGSTYFKFNKEDNFFEKLKSGYYSLLARRIQNSIKFVSPE